MRIPFFSILTIFGVLTTTSIQASDIIVTFANQKCRASVAGHEYNCSIGKNGVTTSKVEGDGKTPLGTFSLRETMIRADKISKSQFRYISIPVQNITEQTGWCDDPKHISYNKMVDLSKFDHTVSHEKLYRDDDLYNVVIVVGYNDNPVVTGKGSAIFVRIASKDYAGTAGGIGFAENDLLKILTKLDENSKLIVKVNS